MNRANLAIAASLLMMSCSPETGNDATYESSGPARGAEGAHGRSGGPPNGSPPPEAFAACDSISEGEACMVETPRGSLEGTCRAIQDALVCVPEGGPGGPPR